VIATFKTSVTLSAARRRRSLETGPVCFFVATEAHHRHGNLKIIISVIDAKTCSDFFTKQSGQARAFFSLTIVLLSQGPSSGLSGSKTVVTHTDE
jgi:hypothetical protein